METTRTGRTPINNTTWESRPKKTKWLDYLLDHLGLNIKDDTGDDIIIYSDSGYEEIEGGAIWESNRQI